MKRILRFLAYSIILITLMPAIELGGFLFKPDLLVVGLLCLLILADKRNYIFQLREVKSLWIIAVIIFFLMLISDNLGIYYLDHTYSFYFPRESIQIFARVAAAVSFMYLAFERIIRPSTFFRIVSLVFLGGLIFGILQKLNIPLITNISLDYYALSNAQVNAISSKVARVFGTSGNVLTWGGLSMLMFLYYYFVEPGKILKYLGVSLALLNVFISGSRAAIGGTIAAFVFIQLFRAIFLEKKITHGFARVMSLLLMGALVIVLVLEYLPEQYEYMAFRFLSTQEDITFQGRGAQFQSYLSFFKVDGMLYLFGIGKPVMDEFGLMEIEFAYILFAYGIVGFVLHYGILLLLFRFVRKLAVFEPKYYLFIVSSLVGFLVFSVGYYFFREIIAGLPFWWLSGYLIGEMLRRRSVSRRYVESAKEDGLIRNTHN